MSETKNENARMSGRVAAMAATNIRGVFFEKVMINRMPSAKSKNTLRKSIKARRQDLATMFLIGYSVCGIKSSKKWLKIAKTIARKGFATKDPIAAPETKCADAIMEKL